MLTAPLAVRNTTDLRNRGRMVAAEHPQLGGVDMQLGREGGVEEELHFVVHRR
jgi:hypothetical protein